jgi:hypothetical protein
VNLDQNDDRGKWNEKDNDVVYNDEELDSSDSDIEDDTSDLDDNQHVVRREVGHSTTNDDSESETNENQVIPVNTRVGRLATAYQTRHFFGDSDWYNYLFNRNRKHCTPYQFKFWL